MRKEPSSIFDSFFNEVDTVEELSSIPDSFFNEVDTVNELSSRGVVSFLRSLKPEVNYACDGGFIF